MNPQYENRVTLRTFWVNCQGSPVTVNFRVNTEVMRSNLAHDIYIRLPSLGPRLVSFSKNFQMFQFDYNSESTSCYSSFPVYTKYQTWSRSFFPCCRVSLYQAHIPLVRLSILLLVHKRRQSEKTTRVNAHLLYRRFV